MHTKQYTTQYWALQRTHHVGIFARRQKQKKSVPYTFEKKNNHTTPPRLTKEENIWV
jgi:hypothetical protein